MSHIQRRGDKRYRARYRGPDNRERSRTFARKIDAERFLTAVEHSKSVGSYIDPALGRVSLSFWTDYWLGGLGGGAQTQDGCDLRVAAPFPHHPRVRGSPTQQYPTIRCAGMGGTDEDRGAVGFTHPSGLHCPAIGSRCSGARQHDRTQPLSRGQVAEVAASRGSVFRAGGCREDRRRAACALRSVDSTAGLAWS